MMMESWDCDQIRCDFRPGIRYDLFALKICGHTLLCSLLLLLTPHQCFDIRHRFDTMFAAESMDDVLLGVPSTLNESVATCFNSKIGGSPLWLTKCPDTNLLTSTSCSQCKKNMIFALQIYAPTEDFERALYVYCCPSSCATQSYGWKVLKDQCAKAKEAGSAINVKSSSGEQRKAATDTPQDNSLKTDWLGLCASSTLQSSERIYLYIMFV
jgi:hypothetical protein